MSGPLTRASENLWITPSEMRVAIFKSMYDRDNTNVIARRCDDVAVAHGFGGEDSMTLLAFRALCRVEVLERQLLDFAHMGMPQFFVTPEQAAAMHPGEIRPVAP